MIIIFFILGLIIGSFLNVVVYRLNVAESILGRSHCPHCKKKIHWQDNVPILSFVLLKGRCRDCEKKISWQYPAMEFFTGIGFALIGNYFFTLSNSQDWITMVFYLVIFSVLMVIAAYDLKYLEIPMLVLWVGVAWTVAYLLFSDWMDFSSSAGIFSSAIFSGALAGIVAFLFFFALSAGSKEKWMGMGDAYVAMLAGLVAGWPNIFLVLLMSFTLGAIFGIVLILLKKKTMQSQIPFAPFLVMGVLLAMFLPKVFPQVNYLFWYLN